jgi:hypothetical protein
MCCLNKIDVRIEIIIFKGNVKLMLWFKIGCFEITKVRFALRDLEANANAIMVRTIIFIFISRVLDVLTYKQCDQSAKVGEFNVTISTGIESFLSR